MEDYFDCPTIISLILLLIPFTSWICGVLTRLRDHCYVAAIIRLVFFGYLIWFIDICLTVFNGCHVHVWRLLKI